MASQRYYAVDWGTHRRFGPAVSKRMAAVKAFGVDEKMVDAIHDLGANKRDALKKMRQMPDPVAYWQVKYITEGTAVKTVVIKLPGGQPDPLALRTYGIVGARIVDATQIPASPQAIGMEATAKANAQRRAS